jgi:phosphoribosylformylglycinamidine synthase
VTAQVEVHIQLKPGMLDPQGETLEHALTAIGYQGVRGMRVGKWITFEIEADDSDAVEAQVEEMCSRLLANPIIERYEYQVTREAHT